MPEIFTTTVYRLDELSDPARDAARAWYRREAPFDGWHDTVYDDFERVCAIVGVDLETRAVRLHGGGTRLAPRIWFSGFASQGDGACFEGRYRYASRTVARMQAYAPDDADLQRIAARLASVQRANFYQLDAMIRHRGRYYHEHSMEISVERSGSGAQADSGAVDEVTEALRDLARWLYRQLEREYDYQTSDSIIDEGILANDYTFTETGRRLP